MKRIISILTLILMLFSTTAFADELPTIFIADTEITGENSITVSISASEDAGFYGGSMNLIYDKTLLTPKSFNTGELLNGFMANAKLNYADNTIRLSWAGVDKITSGGTLFDVTFEVIKAESFETDLIIDELKLGYEDGKKNGITSRNGHIKYVKEASSSVTAGHYVGANVVQNTKPDTQVTGNENDEKQADDAVKDDSKYVSFSDVKQADWFYGYVKTVQEKGLMMGVSETDFAPNAKLTRAMFVTILYRMAGEPETDISAFTDIEAGSWYERAVGWASANGIVTGISDTEFAPNTDITREQMAAIIFRYAKYRGIDTKTGNIKAISHSDIADVSDWATEAIQYCVAASIINGNENGNLLPKKTATRAETAAVITRIYEE